MDIKLVEFIKPIGDIPSNAIGFFDLQQRHYGRIYILREFLNLNENIIPLYDMPIDEKPYIEIDENQLTKEQKNSLKDLIKQINERSITI